MWQDSCLAYFILPAHTGQLLPSPPFLVYGRLPFMSLFATHFATKLALTPLGLEKLDSPGDQILSKSGLSAAKLYCAPLQLSSIAVNLPSGTFAKQH